MDCREIEKNLYLYAELTETEKREVDDHLKNCSSCREVWAAIVNSQQKIQNIAAVRAEPENAARLTHKIMSGIQQETVTRSSVSFLDKILRSVAMRYFFSGMSAALVLLFILQAYPTAVQPSNKTFAPTEATVLLRSVEFKQTYAQLKDKYAACRSPFRPAEAYRDCLLNKLK